jgi:predicted secreted protein
MPVFSAFVVFAFVWFITLLAVLPLRSKTQGEAGEVTPGTPSSAPADPQMRKKVIITTIIATIIWAGIVWVVTSGAVTLDDIDIVNRWVHS